MARTTKKPDERREEFIIAATRLFNEKGYENTSIDDIVKSMGVAKGLFYYYFRSREHLLDTMVDRLLEDMRGIEADMRTADGLTTMEKIRVLFEASDRIRSRSRALVSYFHKERNRHLHFDIERRGTQILIPILQDIIQQGVREGIFDARYPRETAIAYMASLSAIGHENLQDVSTEELRRRTVIIQEITERILGAKPGTLDIYTEFVERKIDQMAEGPPEYF